MSAFNELAHVRLSATRLSLIHDLRTPNGEDLQERLILAELQFEAALDYMLPLEREDNLRQVRK